MAEPKIRFPKFTDDWKQYKIGEVGSFYYGRSCPKWSVTENATIPCVRYGELYTKFGSKIDKVYSYTNIQADKLRFSKGTEVLIPRVGEDPMDYNHCTWLSIPNVAIGEMISVYNTKQNPLFTAMMFNATLRNEFAVRVEGFSVTNLYFEELKNIIVYYPCLEEQQKIADFLSTVDEVISQSEAEVRNLEQQKKAAMQKIFSQKVRFKRDDGTEFPDWESVSLGTIVEKNMIPVANPKTNYVKLAVRSHGKGTFHKYIDDEGLDVDTMYIVKSNHLIVNITFAWEQAIAITKTEDDGTYVSHRFPQYKFVNDNKPLFYQYVILNPRIGYELKLCSPGGAGRNRVLNLSDFLNIQVCRPIPEEQQKIADFLSTYDEAITYTKQELEKWKKLKKGLLQQMFV